MAKRKARVKKVNNEVINEMSKESINKPKRKYTKKSNSNTKDKQTTNKSKSISVKDNEPKAIKPKRKYTRKPKVENKVENKIEDKVELILDGQSKEQKQLILDKSKQDIKEITDRMGNVNSCCTETVKEDPNININNKPSFVGKIFNFFKRIFK